MSDIGVSNNNNNQVRQVKLEEEMKKSYLDYAMSVIVSRALPDARDGLKPVHRRIIYSMFENSYYYNKPFRKSARIVGDVMGKYHPHGDSAIYDAMVRLTQSFSLRLPLINGQGNFGSMDGDPAAAMRYTEARLAMSAHYLIEDIDKDTVAFRPNYDDSEQEPSVLPARFPNLLVNGSSGIAVGMATNIPTHNLGELLKATNYLLDHEDCEIDDLLQFVNGPDFPTGGKVIGKAGIYSYLTTGRGSITIAGTCHIEDKNKNSSTIIITETPWQVNKSKLVEEISNLKEKGDGKSTDVISTVRDESDRHGVRVVVELKRDVSPDLVINYLQKYTSFHVSFGCNMLAIDNGVPKQMNLKDMLSAFIDFRKSVVRNRTMFLLNKARERAHIYCGLGVAVENIDQIIELIKSAKNTNEAKDQLMSVHWSAGQVESYIMLLNDELSTVQDGKYYLSESQAKSILDLRLHRLTGLEREKIMLDLEGLAQEIKNYLEILNSSQRLVQIIKDEFLELEEKFSQPRITTVEESQSDLSEADFVTKEDMIVTISDSGYIKRVPISSYRSQRRGGKGKQGMKTKEEDFVTDLFVANTHDDILFFTSSGLVFKIKCYKIPESGLTTIGRAIINLIAIDKDDKVTTVLPMNDHDYQENISLIFATKLGLVRKSSVNDFIRINANGKTAIKLEDKDSLINVHKSTEDKDILINTKLGKSIRFNISNELRTVKTRASVGVRGIKLSPKDEVINMSILNHEKIDTIEKRDAYLSYASTLRRQEGETSNYDSGVTEVNLTNDEIKEFQDKEEFILTVTSKGFGKLTSAYEYRITSRAGSGFLSAKLSSKNGDIVSVFTVDPQTDDIMIMSNNGKVIRLPVKGIRISGRVSVGVTLFRVDSSESVVSVSKINNDENDDIIINDDHYANLNNND